MTTTKIECKATFVGFCAVPGSLSENHVFQCVRDLILSQTNHNQQQVEKISSTEPSKSSSNVLHKEEGNDGKISNGENDQKTNLWTVSIEANELKWVYSDSMALTTFSSRKCNRALFSNILFCYLNAQLPNVIVWVLTKNNCDDSPDGKIETEALVWQCLNEKDAIHLRDAYKLIRSKKKLEKIEAINKAKQKNSEKVIVNQKLSEKVNGNNCEQQSTRMTSSKQENDETNNRFNAMEQHLPTSEANETLEDLLYRSSKPNPNREILVASSIHYKNSRNNRPQTRQRQPALLLQATNNTSLSSLSSPTTTHTRQTTNNVIPIVVSRQNSSNAYWNQYPSESEFDTTRINSYLNALNLSRRNRSNLSTNKQNGKHIRSRSVESPLNRLRMSIHKPVNSFLNAINSPSGAKMNSSNNLQTANSSNIPSRGVLVTRSESLNSEGSSISGESGICEFNAGGNHPAKSVLKKNSPNTSVHIGPGKKNVTFSAYATIQVMDG